MPILIMQQLQPLRHFDLDENDDHQKAGNFRQIESKVLDTLKLFIKVSLLGYFSFVCRFLIGGFMLSRDLVEYFMKKNDIVTLKDEVLHICKLQHLA